MADRDEPWLRDALVTAEAPVEDATPMRRLAGVHEVARRSRRRRRGTAIGAAVAVLGWKAPPVWPPGSLHHDHPAPEPALGTGAPRHRHGLRTDPAWPRSPLPADPISVVGCTSYAAMGVPGAAFSLQPAVTTDLDRLVDAVNGAAGDRPADDMHV